MINIPTYVPTVAGLNVNMPTPTVAVNQFNICTEAYPGMFAFAPEGRPRTRPPTTLGAILAIPAVPEKDQELGPLYPIQFLKV